MLTPIRGRLPGIPFVDHPLTPPPHALIPQPDRSIRVRFTLRQLKLPLRKPAWEARNAITQQYGTNSDKHFVHQVLFEETARQFAPASQINVLPRSPLELLHEGRERPAHHFESVAFARLPSPRDNVVGHARRVGDLAALAHLHPRCRGLAAHDGGIDFGEEVRHHRFPFLVDDQKIDSAIPPRNIAVYADSESQDDFSCHPAIVNETTSR
jgi:hypothetical protein